MKQRVTKNKIILKGGRKYLQEVKKINKEIAKMRRVADLTNDKIEQLNSSLRELDGLLDRLR